MRLLHANKQTILHFNLTVQNPVSSKKALTKTSLLYFKIKLYSLFQLSVSYCLNTAQTLNEPSPRQFCIEPFKSREQRPLDLLEFQIRKMSIQVYFDPRIMTDIASMFGPYNKELIKMIFIVKNSD